eukprot:3325764-Pyramimonas_sp.AAC.1
MIYGMLCILLDVGGNINIIGLKTAQTFERVSRSHGHDIKNLDLQKIVRERSGQRSRRSRDASALQNRSQ